MRLIDADTLKKNMEFICMGVMAGTEPYNAPLTEIDNAPTVDDRTEEVISLQQTIRRLQEGIEDDTPAGTWIPEEETYTDLSGTIETYTRFQCDRCMQGQNFGPYPFCPWCGSKMNPEIREETTI